MLIAVSMQLRVSLTIRFESQLIMLQLGKIIGLYL